LGFVGADAEDPGAGDAGGRAVGGPGVRGRNHHAGPQSSLRLPPLALTGTAWIIHGGLYICGVVPDLDPVGLLALLDPDPDPDT